MGLGKLFLSLLVDLQYSNIVLPECFILLTASRAFGCVEKISRKV